MKAFFDGIFIPKKDLEEAGINYPIKLEYYKTSENENIEAKYGIEIVKTEYLEGNVKIESKEVKNILNNEEEQEKILKLLKDNQVTPIGVEDVLEEILPKWIIKDRTTYKKDSIYNNTIFLIENNNKKKLKKYC